MAGEKEVKAQVRLRFWNVKRERMVVNRNLQVTVKKGGGMTMKTLEGMLSKVDAADGGERVRLAVLPSDYRMAHERPWQRNAISTKCAEMDSEVPRLMGVSKAILENVIFCHQEESNWPLAEPSALKKKFDDIFEASKSVASLLVAIWAYRRP
jgi:DNA repair protein RAD50